MEISTYPEWNTTRGIISPILTNIYLDRFDQYIEQTIIPRFTRGTKRKKKLEYKRLENRIRYLRKKGASWETIRPLRKEYLRTQSVEPFDPDYRRLRYIRYADDFLLGFAGPKNEAEEIKNLTGTFLRDHLKLEMSPEKTLITHAGTELAGFLGYEIGAGSPKRGSSRRNLLLRVPVRKIAEQAAKYKKNGKVIHRSELLNESDYDIISLYGSQYRGIVQYYAFAENRHWLNRLRWVMEVSLLKTLAAKYKSTVMKMFWKYKSEITHRGKTLRCFEVRVPRPGKDPLIARFGGVSLSPEPFAKILDNFTDLDRIYGRTELIQRLLADTCELCGSRENVQVHHVRKLADLKVKGRKAKPPWIQVMATRRRKTLIVCRSCHSNIHAGKPTGVLP